MRPCTSPINESNSIIMLVLHVHDLIIHEMLREKERQGQQKDKATQHNSPKAVIFQRMYMCDFSCMASKGGIPSPTICHSRDGSNSGTIHYYPTLKVTVVACFNFGGEKFQCTPPPPRYCAWRRACECTCILHMHT